MNNEVEIEITQEDINAAVKAKMLSGSFVPSRSCPYALAARRVFNKTEGEPSISAGAALIYLYFGTSKSVAYAPLNTGPMEKFTCNFDNGRPVTPMKVKLKKVEKK